MRYKRKWKPSKEKAKEFAKQMEEIEEFISNNNIKASSSRDSYYFTIDNISYRVSNHSIEASNRCAYDPITHELRRDVYHPHGRRDDVVYIHAGKTRIIQIYNDLMNGKQLDGRGNPMRGV